METPPLPSSANFLDLQRETPYYAHLKRHVWSLFIQYSLSIQPLWSISAYSVHNTHFYTICWFKFTLYSPVCTYTYTEIKYLSSTAYGQ